MEDPKRELYWDIVKGIGIFVIVFGHSGLVNALSMGIINYFNLAIFFFVSGFLYKEKYSVDLHRYVGRKLESLWWPLTKYTIAFILLHNLFLTLNIYSTVSDKASIIPTVKYGLFDSVGHVAGALLATTQPELMGGAMWFIMPLFVSMVLFCAFHNAAYRFKLSNTLKELFVLCCVMAAGIFGIIYIRRSLTLPWRADIALYAVPLVYSGYLAKKYWDRIPFNWLLLSIAVGVLYYCYQQGARILYFPGKIDKIPLVYIANLCGIYALLYGATILKKFLRFSKIVSVLGRYSFHIMALHFLSFKLVNLVDVIINHKPSYMIASFAVSNTDWWIAYLCVGLIVPILGVYAYKYFESRVYLWSTTLLHVHEPIRQVANTPKRNVRKRYARRQNHS